MPAGEIGRLFYTLGIDTKEFDTKLENAKRKVNSFSEGIISAGDKVSAFGRKMSDFGSSVTKYVGLPLAGIGAASWKMAEDFDTAMDKVVGLVGISRSQLNAWQKDLKNISSETAVSLAELGEGLFFITSAGLRGKKAIEALEASAKATTVGLGDMKTIADAVTSAVNAYSKQGMSATRATEILTAAVRMGKLEASALAPVLGRILPTASALGVAFEDVAGTIAVMSRTGTDAAEAVTSLTAIFSSFLKPSKEATEALAVVGLKFSDLREVLKKPGGVIEVMRLLDEKFAGNEEALAKIIPNVRAFRGAMNVLAQEQTTVNEVMKGTRDSVGILDEAFKASTDDAFFKFRQAIQRLKTSLVDLGGVLSTVLAPIIGDTSKKIDEVTKGFQKLDAETQKQYVRFGLLAIALGPIIWLVGQIISGIGLLINAFGWIVAHPIVIVLGVIAMMLYRVYDAFVTARRGGEGLIVAMLEASKAANPLVFAMELVKKAIREAFNWAALNIEPFRNFINRIIFYINQLIEAWNKSPLGKVTKIGTVGYVGTTKKGGKPIGGAIPFQKGGVVKYPTLALIGEKEPEAVIPLSKLPALQSEAIEVVIRPTGGAEQLVEAVVRRITKREARLWK